MQRVLIYFLSLFMLHVLCNPVEFKLNVSKYSDIPAVQRLQEYLRIDTSREENIELSTEFWRRQAEDLGLEFTVYRPAGLPICVLTWKGTHPELPSIMLNSHADVVPVYESQWMYPPFAAHIDENGDLYARGAQDCKTIAMQYLEAVRKLKQSQVALKRTIHITVMPDEETGGFRGMKSFIEMDEFKSLYIGFVLDEGISSSDERLLAIYQEKRPWQMEITIHEKSGHSANMSDTYIVHKLQNLIEMTMKYREEQMKIKKSRPPLDFGAYTSLHINKIKGGIANNIIPSEITVVIDVRLSEAETATDMQKRVSSWLNSLGDDTEIKFIRKFDHTLATAIDDSNPFWVAMRDTLKDIGITLMPIVCPATSDMIFLRSATGIPAFGFAANRHVRGRFHDNNEYIPVSEFLKGIDIYNLLLKKIGNL